MNRIDTLALRRTVLASEAAAARPAAAYGMDDLKLFVSACLGGLVFFTTFIG